MCAIESAAFHNPTALVRVLVTGTPNISCQFYRVVHRLTNVVVDVIDLDAFFHSTPLEDWYFRSQWKESPFRVAHLSDALRYLVVWRNGGVYLDLDFIVLRCLSGIQNSLFYQEADLPANGILFFDRGHAFLLKVMQGCEASYDPYDWTTIGPKLMVWTYSDLCATSDCGGVKILPKEMAFPVAYWNWTDYFEPKSATSVLNKSEECLAVHVWNRLSADRVVWTGNGSAYDVLAKRHCPSTYSVMTTNGYF